jgi:hypothetical protein
MIKANAAANQSDFRIVLPFRNLGPAYYATPDPGIDSSESLDDDSTSRRLDVGC